MRKKVCEIERSLIYTLYANIHFFTFFSLSYFKEREREREIEREKERERGREGKMTIIIA